MEWEQNEGGLEWEQNEGGVQVDLWMKGDLSGRVGQRSNGGEMVIWVVEEVCKTLGWYILKLELGRMK